MKHSYLPEILLQAYPTLPRPQGVALAILEASKSGACALEEIIALVEADPVLNTRLGKLTRACADGSKSSQPLQQGLQAMGPVAIKNLALAFSLVDQYSTGLCIGFDYQRFWNESLLMGFILQEVVNLAHRQGAWELGSWGLLCRVGCLGLATAHPIQYAKLLRTHGDDTTLVETEQAWLDTNHLSLGVSLLSLWGLPEHMVEAVMHHESVDSVAGPVPHDAFVACAMKLAHRAARALCHPHHGEGSLDEALKAFAAVHRLATVELGQGIQRALAHTLACGELLGLEPCPCGGETGGKANPAKAAGKTDGPLKILIIEDDPILKRLLQTWLKIEIGHTLISASNGEEALVLAEHHLPQVIITDWRMPVMDGIAFCKALRQSTWGESMYVLMLTSASGDEDLVQAFEAGVDDFQSKPLNRQALGARLRAAWRYVQLRAAWISDNERLERDNARMELTIRRLQLSSMRDGLTDLANRRAGQVAIAQAIATGQRHGMQMCVIGLDLDSFKLLTTSAGPDAANEVLQLVAMTLQQAARVEDTVCRWGTNDFMVIAPGLHKQEGIAAAKRFRSLIANHHISLESVTVGVTVSVGVACWDSESKARDQLLGEVYQAVAEARQAGGNRVAAFEPD